MRRMHLFELEDQTWFPALLRNAGTGYIAEIVRFTHMMSGAMPHLRKALDAGETNRIIDLCSGSGGPALLVLEQLEREGRQVTALCTDLFPNHDSLDYARSQSDGRLEYEPSPVDATEVPAELVGTRTVFNAFHHFRPPQARRILEDAVRSGQPIAVFEFVGREWHTLPGMLGVPFAVMAFLPRVRPFHWAWIPLTYLLPIIPAFVFWDGLVSCLRVYEPAELDELTQGLDEFVWESGLFELPRTPGHGTYLVGIPRR